MRNGSYENSTVETVAQKLPEARAYLREARIDTTSRLSLRDAAAAASVVPDELLAQVEARIRRQARRANEQAIAAALALEIAEDEEEFMLI
ncbi:MAG: hypothetical protein HGA45_00555 [Chloroflexales bacterium]|nr:hypothetical protein [Chloroflexales bacterium]